MKIITRGELPVAAAAVDDGGLVVVPTRRWYMLCGRADDADVVARIFALKQRPVGRTLLHVTRSPAEARATFAWSEEAEFLAARFWPGDLALALSWRRPADCARMSAVGAREALVACAEGVLGELARRCAAPIAATSANISPHGDEPGTYPALTLAEARSFARSASADVAVVVDGGVCPSPGDMTIVSCAERAAVLRRPGAVARRAIEAAMSEAGLRLTPEHRVSSP